VVLAKGIADSGSAQPSSESVNGSRGRWWQVQGKEGDCEGKCQAKMAKRKSIRHWQHDCEGKCQAKMAKRKSTRHWQHEYQSK
jgi:uncharacterized low-complexity protein